MVKRNKSNVTKDCIFFFPVEIRYHLNMLVAQSCLTLQSMDCSLSSSSVHGILQVRIVEWVAIPFSRGDLANPGFKPGSLALQADSLLSEPPGKPIYAKVLNLFLITSRSESPKNQSFIHLTVIMCLFYASLCWHTKDELDMVPYS